MILIILVVQSNPVNTDTQETIESVRSKRVQYGEDVRPFFSLGQGSFVLALVAVFSHPFCVMFRVELKSCE